MTQARSLSEVPDSRSSEELPGKARKRALVVDADADLLAFAAEALHSFRPGFDVATAADLAQAAAWLDTFPPDLVLLGADHVEIERSEFATRLRDQIRAGACKIILMSDGPSPEVRLDPTRVHAHAVLAKPLSLKTLLAVVRRLA